MTARQQRRREEHKARKEANKMQNQMDQGQEAVIPPARPETERSAINRAEINKQNAQHSTGPRTEPGKLASSSNAFKHGLYSKQLILPGEDPAELDALRNDLRSEHQPGTTTEEILVNELAEHYWRLRRMRKYEARAMATGTLEELEKSLALLPIIQRTMASAERGFHKALATLRQLQKDRGFVPHKTEPQAQSVSQQAAEAIGKFSLAAQQHGFVSQKMLPSTSAYIVDPEEAYLQAAGHLTASNRNRGISGERFIDVN